MLKIMMKFYIIKTNTIQKGYENAPNTTFIAWDKNGKPIRENAANAYKYFTKDGIKTVIKLNNINNEDWRPYLLTMIINEIEI